LRSWKAQYSTIRFAPITLIQVIFAAGSVYLLLAHQASTGRRIADQKQADALDRVAEVIDFMKELGQSWSGALKIVDIFEKLLDVQRQRMHEAIELSKARKSSRRANRPPTSAAGDVSNGTPLLSVDSAEDFAQLSDDGFLQSSMQSSSLQLPTTYDSDGGSATDEAAMVPTPPFFEQIGLGNQGMHNALDLLVDPQRGFGSAGTMFDFAGTGWGMPNGDALSFLPFMAPDSPNLQYLSTPPDCNFSNTSVDASAAPPLNSFHGYPSYMHAPAQYSFDGMGPSGAPMDFDARVNIYPTNDAEDQPLAAMIAAMQTGSYSIY